MIFTCVALLSIQYESLLSSFKILLVIVRIHLLGHTPPSSSRRTAVMLHQGIALRFNHHRSILKRSERQSVIVHAKKVSGIIPFAEHKSKAARKIVSRAAVPEIVKCQCTCPIRFALICLFAAEQRGEKEKIKLL